MGAAKRDDVNEAQDGQHHSQPNPMKKAAHQNAR
jgi:hypothetical protein